MQNLAHFDMGTSVYSREEISDLILDRLPATFLLAIASIFTAMMLAWPMGIVAALRKDSIFDHGAMMFAMCGVSIPNFWLGPLLILIFSYWLGWLPVSGMGEISAIVLPALTLGTSLAALQSRMIRASLLEVLNEDYIRAARARGMTATHVVIRHAIRNSLLPVLTVMGIQFGALLTGAVVTEYVFDWPGIGQLMIEAIHKRDYPLVQACILLISITYVFVNMLTDWIYVLLDPRIRLEN